MENKTKVLQIGLVNWAEVFPDAIHESIEWQFLDCSTTTEATCQALIQKKKRRAFDVVVVSDELNNTLLEDLSPLIEAYTLIMDRRFQSQVSQQMQRTKLPVYLSFHTPHSVLDTIYHYFFPGQSGGKLHVNQAEVSENFEGDVQFWGEHRLCVNGDFSPFKSQPLITWQYNRGFYERSKKIWLEFSHSENVSFSLVVHGFRDNSTDVMKVWRFAEDEVRAGMELPYEEGLGFVSVSLWPRGYGEIEVGPLHFRDTRGPYGEYLPGGKKVSDAQNEELDYFFHPGDLKPPLAVYFSGYRSLEGFEGFYMMKKMGTPFLLIADPRLEGGSFYLGSEQLETSIRGVIQTHLNSLGFSNQELILSGLSMGTFGALYHGSFLHPHSIIVGKPLVNLGTMAEKERIIRPGGFPTSLDLLQSLTGRQDKGGIQALNHRFWSAFDAADFRDTQFVMAYMKDDDYDDTAYQDVLEHLLTKETRVIGKGISGRHNDNSEAINQWFINHFRRILDEDFHRGGEHAI